MYKVTLIFLSILLHGIIASADDISLGYCDGGNVENSISGINAAAIRLDKNDFSMYEGSTISGVRIGIGTDAPKGITIFIKSAFDNSNLLSYKSETLYKGWNDIYFDKSITFPASDIIVGCELPSDVSIGQSSIPGLTSSNSCWILNGSQWQNMSLAGSSPLCIQLLIDGDSYSRNDGALINAYDAKIQTGKPFTLKGNIRNNTNKILNNAKIDFKAGDLNVECDAIMDNILPGEIGEYSITVNDDLQIGEYTANLNLLSVADAPDEFDFNNAAVCKLDVVEDIVVRKILIEEFTGQGCSNCPGGQSRIHSAMADMDNIILVAHHTGFGTDRMTAKGSDSLHFFYNQKGTYAPAMMVDRKQHGNNPGPVSTVGDVTAIRSRLEEYEKIPAEMSLEIKRNYDDESKGLTVQVKVKKIKGMEIGENPVLNIFLVESGIIDYQSPNYTNYEHNDVNRLFVTQPLGDLLHLENQDSQTCTYPVSLDENWKPENMEIVAFVSNYDSSDCNNCIVYNADKCPLIGKDEIEIEQPGALFETHEKATIEHIYNLTGNKLSSLQNGVNIVRYSDGSVKKIVVRN